MAEPVKDWTTDYDIFDAGVHQGSVPDLGRDPRQSARSPTPSAGAAPSCPRATRTSSTSRSDIQHFSSRDVLVAAVDAAAGQDGRSYAEPSEELVPQYNVGAPPITSDPPVHTWARKLLLPPFSVTSVAKWEQETRELCATLIDGFIANGRRTAPPTTRSRSRRASSPACSASRRRWPATFTEWVRGFLELGLTEPGAARASPARNIFGYLDEQHPGAQGEPAATT